MPIESALALAREELSMDVALVSRVERGRETVLHVDGEEIPALAVGNSVPLDQTICRRVLDGEIGPAVPDIAARPSLASLGIVRATGVRSYLGVPLRLTRRGVYMLCCLAREPRPLGPRDVRFLEGVGATVAAALAASVVVADPHDLPVRG